MSYLAIYLIGALIMVVIALIAILSTGKIQLSDLIMIPVAGVLSWGGIVVLLAVLMCKGIELWLYVHGKNKVLWRKN